MIDGRDFAVVMAWSFCCAPLHAAREFAQPPQGAEFFRIAPPGGAAPVRIVMTANLLTDLRHRSIRWLSGTEVSSQQKKPVDTAEMRRPALPGEVAGKVGDRPSCPDQGAPGQRAAGIRRWRWS